MPNDEIERIDFERNRWLENQFRPAVTESTRLPKAHRQPLYTPVETGALDYAAKLGVPGGFPYTRGVYQRMYLERPWVMRQIVGYGTASETNERFRYLLDHGESGITAVYDQATVMGLDSDDPLAYGEVGRTGVPVDTIEDMHLMFEGLPIERVHTALLASYGSAPAIFACFVAMVQEVGLSLADLPGSIQNHLIPFYVALPKCAYLPPRAAFRCVSDTFDFCSEHMPRFTPINITAHIVRESGATNVQELVFCLAFGAAHVEHAIGQGLAVDSFGPRLAFYFSASLNFFEEIAKYRAARRVWATLMRDRFGAKDPRSHQLRFHGQTSAFTAVAQEPRNNIMRGTYEAMAAILGGAQSVNVTPYDEAYNIPSEEAVRLALRTNQVIYHETDIAEAIDPFGGSWYVESLTDEFEQVAWDGLRRIEELGDGSLLEGVIAGIESGSFLEEVTESLHERENAIENADRTVVGLNRFRDESAETGRFDVFAVSQDLEDRQVERLGKIRSERNVVAVAETLDAVRDAAAGDGNIIAAMVDAARARATVGEMTQVLIDVFGIYEQKTVI